MNVHVRLAQAVRVNSVIRAWAATYGAIRFGGMVAAIDATTVALVAAILSFVGAIIVAIIDSRSRKSDPMARELIQALSRAEEDKALAEKREAEATQREALLKAELEHVVHDRPPRARRRREPND